MTKIHRDSLKKRGVDPIIKTFRNAPAFNRLWLTNERHLTLTQYVGFLLISFFMACGAIMFLSAGIADFTAGNNGWIVSFGLAVPFILLGAGGLLRVFNDLFRS